MNSTLEKVTERICQRSAENRASYLERMHRAAGEGPLRGALSCSNLAHGFAACGKSDKTMESPGILLRFRWPRLFGCSGPPRLLAGLSWFIPVTPPPLVNSLYSFGTQFWLLAPPPSSSRPCPPAPPVSTRMYGSLRFTGAFPFASRCCRMRSIFLS